ncbi:MAG: acyl-CoA thioesterase, partial [Hyphomicrobiaceae bacterium]
YGHVNNVIYYSYFDTLINRYLIEEGGLDFANGPVIGLAVESLCRYNKSFTYPEEIEGGLRVGRLGTSSVRYEIGLFSSDANEAHARAEGHFVHVFVDRATQRPIPIPEPMRSALERLLVKGAVA